MNASRDRSAGSNQSKGKEMSLDAMKLALDELKSLQPIMANGLLEQRQLDFIDPHIDRAITALRGAIEQAEQPRQWQGLTKDELWELWESNTEQPFPEWFVDFKRAYEVIEAKLKEKNT